MKLYYHKADGGAEYLMDNFVGWEHNGKKGKEGVFQGSKYIVRIDGDITKDAELMTSVEDDIKETLIKYKEQAIEMKIDADELWWSIYNDLKHNKRVI